MLPVGGWDLKHYDSIQILRGVAAMAVVVHHAIGTHTVYASRGWTQPTGLDASIGAAGVDVFFVITGFIMAGISRFFDEQPIGAKDFFERRITRLVPVYWFYTTVMLALYFAMPIMFHTLDTNALHIVGSYLFIPFQRSSGGTDPIIPVGWTLNIEMLFYLVFGLLLLAPRRHRLFAVVTACAALCVIHQLYIEFLYGIVIGRIYFGGFKIAERNAALIMAIGFGLFAFLPNDVDIRAYTWGVAASLIVFAAASIERRLPFTVVGDASYSIYLSHIFTIPVVLRISLGADPYVSIAIAIVASAIVGIAAYMLIEKPMIDFMRGRKKHHSEPAAVSTHADPL